DLWSGPQRSIALEIGGRLRPLVDYGRLWDSSPRQVSRKSGGRNSEIGGSNVRGTMFRRRTSTQAVKQHENQCPTYEDRESQCTWTREAYWRNHGNSAAN